MTWDIVEHDNGSVTIDPRDDITCGYRAITIKLQGVYIIVRYGLQHDKKAGVTVELYKDEDFNKFQMVPSSDIDFLKYLSKEDLFLDEDDEEVYDFDEDKGNKDVILRDEEGNTWSG